MTKNKITKQFIFKGQTPQQFLRNQNTTELIHKNIYALLQKSMEKDFKFYKLISVSVMVENRKILNQLVKSDPEILVCNCLDEISIKHTLLVTKIFHSYQAMAVSQALKTNFLKNEKFITDKPDGIKPLVNDVVLVCKEQPSMGLVMEILSTRRVVVQHKSPILALIFKPEMPHLLEAFWSRLKQKLT